MSRSDNRSSEDPCRKTYQTLPDIFWHFDRLPPAIRAILSNAARNWSTKSIVKIYFDLCVEGRSEQEVVEIMRRWLERQDARNIANFAVYYAKKYNTPYPHVAAGATVQHSGVTP